MTSAQVVETSVKVTPNSPSHSHPDDHNLRTYDMTPGFKPFTVKLIKAKKASRMVYDKLITEKSTVPTVSQQKWIEDCNLDQNKITWSTAYQLAHKITKSTKLREFQFKLLHRRIPTNTFLTKIRIKENPQCSFCKD